MADTEKQGEAEVGYGCTCGFKTLDGKELRRHVFVQSGKDGKGTHRSKGRVDMESGEVVMDVWNKRTLSEKKDSAPSLTKPKKTKGKKAAGELSRSGDHHWMDDIPASGTITRDLDEAQAIEFTPRVLKADYTPIMRSARIAAVREWGWPADMPLEDFVDTCLFIIFNDRDIVLTGYSIRTNNGG